MTPNQRKTWDRMVEIVRADGSAYLSMSCKRMDAILAMDDENARLRTREAEEKP